MPEESENDADPQQEGSLAWFCAQDRRKLVEGGANPLCVNVGNVLDVTLERMQARFLVKIGIFPTSPLAANQVRNCWLSLAVITMMSFLFHFHIPPAHYMTCPRPALSAVIPERQQAMPSPTKRPMAHPCRCRLPPKKGNCPKVQTRRQRRPNVAR